MWVEGRCEGVDECLKGVFAAVAQGNFLLITIALAEGFGDFLQVFVVEFHTQDLGLQSSVPEVILCGSVDRPGAIFTLELYDFVGIKIQPFEARVDLLLNVVRALDQSLLQPVEHTVGGQQIAAS